MALGNLRTHLWGHLPVTPFRKLIESEPHVPRFTPEEVDHGWKEREADVHGVAIIHTHAAGIDIGSRFHVAAVSPDLRDEPVRTFQAFTSDLHRMADG